MTWLAETAPGSTEWERVFGVTPDVHRTFEEVYRDLWNLGRIDPVLLELARLRMATILRSDAERRLRYLPALDAGLTEDKIADLHLWATSPSFSATERAVLAFAELYVIDPHVIGDDECQAVLAHLSPAEASALTMACAFFDATIRFRLALGITPDGDDPVVVIDPAVDALA